MTHIFLAVVAISSREPVWATFTLLVDSPVVEHFLMLQANLAFFGWHPFLFSMLLLAIFESGFQGREWWMPLFVFLVNMIVALRAISNASTCGLSLTKSCRGP